MLLTLCHVFLVLSISMRPRHRVLWEQVKRQANHILVFLLSTAAVIKVIWLCCFKVKIVLTLFFLGSNTFYHWYSIACEKSRETGLKLALFFVLAKFKGRLFSMSVCKYQSKFQNIAFLLVDIQIWIDFYALTWQIY